MERLDRNKNPDPYYSKDRANFYTECAICGDEHHVDEMVQPLRYSEDYICPACDAEYTFCDSCGTWVKRDAYVERECCCVGCLVVD